MITGLQEHLECVTKQQSTGTILLRKGGDITLALSHSLAANYKLKSGTAGMAAQSLLSKATGNCDDSRCMLYEVCDTLNDKVHNTINKILHEETQKGIDLSTVKIEEWIKKSDKTIWDALLLITRTRSERNLHAQEVINNKLSDAKKLRLFYIICIIHFATDGRCHIPIHTLLTDIVYTHGGSHELVQILNRFGAISSADTHSRYVDFVVKHTKKQQHMFNVNDFLVASIDNIDFLRSYAAVYSGDQQRSWHGTTIQIMHPKPTTTEETCVVRPKRLS